MEKMNFNGKVVSFSNKEGTLAVFNPEFQEIQNKIFVCGTIPKSATTNNWAEGKLCAVSWDDVLDYIVFDSLEEYVKLIQLSEDD